MRGTEVNGCDVTTVSWTGPGDALCWKGAQYADLSTQSNGGQQHRPPEGGSLKHFVEDKRINDSCPLSAGEAADL